MIVPIPMDLLFSLAFIVVLPFNAPFHHRLNLNAIKLAAKVRISLSLFASIFPLCISSGIPGLDALFCVQTFHMHAVKYEYHLNSQSYK